MSRGFVLLDTQTSTEHLKKMGIVEIPRSAYLKRLARPRAAADIPSVTIGAVKLVRNPDAIRNRTRARSARAEQASTLRRGTCLAKELVTHVETTEPPARALEDRAPT